MKLSKDDVKMLAEVERKMDRGETPFVVLRGVRLAMMQPAMIEFGLVSGQTINDIIAEEITRFNLDWIQSQIDEQKLIKGLK